MKNLKEQNPHLFSQGHRKFELVYGMLLWFIKFRIKLNEIKFRVEPSLGFLQETTLNY